MQRLYVSGAVRPLKWLLGVKWLIDQNVANFVKKNRRFSVNNWFSIHSVSIFSNGLV
jgi:hypothetical protein